MNVMSAGSRRVVHRPRDPGSGLAPWRDAAVRVPTDGPATARRPTPESAAVNPVSSSRQAHGAPPGHSAGGPGERRTSQPYGLAGLNGHVPVSVSAEELLTRQQVPSERESCGGPLRTWWWG